MRSYRIARAIRMRRRFAPSDCNWSWRPIRIIRRRRTMRSRLRNYRTTWNGGIQKSDEARLDGKRRRKIFSKTPAENARKIFPGYMATELLDIDFLFDTEPEKELRYTCKGE